LNFIYDHTDYKLFLQDLANEFGCPFDGETLQFLPHIGNGFIRLTDMPGGLQAITSSYTAANDFSFLRTAKFPEIFTLRIDYIELTDGAHIELGDTAYTPAVPVYANMLMTSSRFNHKIVIKKGTKVRSINIMLKPEWIKKYFIFIDVPFWLNYIHTLNLGGINRVPINFDCREILFSLINLEPQNPAYLFLAQARIFELLDYYTKQIDRQKNILSNRDVMFYDVSKIIGLDVFINQTIEQQANIPSITEMAAHVTMSESKLKSLFKKVYNQSIVEYFNDCRLNNARKLLQTPGINVKEVSASFGYKSVQHFTTAFKKQFGLPPASLLKKEIS
jgi:AraC-like DNA-binding protein